MGAWVYAHHPSTRFLCFSWRVGHELDAPVHRWTPGDPYPDWVINPGDYEFYAWNAQFEYALWDALLPSDVPPGDQWHDPMAKAAAMGLPLALGYCGEALGLTGDDAKDKAGKRLIQQLCKPGKHNDDPELLAQLYEYCDQDVVAECKIDSMLLNLIPDERRLWVQTFDANNAGISVDRDAAQFLEAEVEQIKSLLDERTHELTGGAVKTMRQAAASQGYLNGAFDLGLTSMRKHELAEVLTRDDLPDTARELIEIRLAASKTSVKKITTMLDASEHDGRLHGMLQYCGAGRTGRFSGRLVQLHNMPRGSFKDTETCIDEWRAAA